MRETIRLVTRQREVLIDITAQVREVVDRSGVRNGLVNLYAQGATAAIPVAEPVDVAALARSEGWPRSTAPTAWCLTPA